MQSDRISFAIIIVDNELDLIQMVDNSINSDTGNHSLAIVLSVYA